MTEQQLTAIKSLAERFNSDLDHTDVMHRPFGLPSGWVSVVVFRPEQGKAPHLCQTPAIVAGVAPNGSINS